ncbi:ADP-L-glycero-D-manno-heptose-6-epimerase [subsurface metagenome]
MKVLVTGGAGFIGSHTVDLLLERGYKVRILDGLFPPVHLNKEKPSYVSRDAEFVLGDVRNKKDWERDLKGVDVVFHLAAYQDYLTDFSRFFQVNTVGTALLYEVIVERKLDIKKVIIGSSQAVYGEGKYRYPRDGTVYPNLRSLEQLERGDWEVKCPECGGKTGMQLTDESRINPQNQYAISKYSQELISLNLGKRYKIPTVCLRYSIVQGPRQSFCNLYSGALRTISLSIYFKRRPVIYEDGLQLRDYVNIEDAVRANLLVMEDPGTDYPTKDGACMRDCIHVVDLARAHILALDASDELKARIYNLGSGEEYTVRKVIETAREVTGVDIPTVGWKDVPEIRRYWWPLQNGPRRSLDGSHNTMIWG